MLRALRFASRFILLIAALTLIPAALAPSAPDSSPYMSALSDLTVGSALAAPRLPGCNERWCGTTGTTCTVARVMKCKVKGGVCQDADC